MKFIKVKYFLFLGLAGLVIACHSKREASEKERGSGQSDSTQYRLTELNSLILKDAENAKLFDERAALHNTMENYQEALKDGITAVKLDSGRSDYYLTLADAYLGLGKLQSSLQNLEKAIILDSRNIKAILKLAEINIIFGEYKKALDEIDLAIKLDELEPKSYFLRGIILLEKKDTLLAIRNFQKAIDVNQDYFDAHLQLGMIYSEKKNKLAVDYLNNALNIKPGNSDVSYYLAMFYQENENYGEAIKIYEQLLQKDPQFYFALYNIGYINLVYIKDYPKAVEYFTKVIELKPDYTDAWYNRGFAWELQKNVENSQMDYKKALEITPNYDKAVQGLNRIEDYLSTTK